LIPRLEKYGDASWAAALTVWGEPTGSSDTLPRLLVNPSESRIPRKERRVSRGKVYITGNKIGPPTFDQIIAMTKRLTGRDPTPEEFARAKAKWDAFCAQKAVQAVDTSDTLDDPEKLVDPPPTEEESYQESAEEEQQYRRRPK
jgi:hypothetical protein